MERAGHPRGGLQAIQVVVRQGRAVPVDPMKPTLKAHGSKRLKVEHEKLVSNFAFYFNLRHFTKRFLHPDVVEPYDYVFVWDEDIDLHTDGFDPGKRCRLYQ